MTVIDTHLRVDGNVLGHDLVNQILDELTIKNKAKQEAKRAQRYGWATMPDNFLLANLYGDTLIMPRGYALQYKLLLQEHDMSPSWIDKRRWRYGKPIALSSGFHFRPHQPAAIRAIRKHQQGIYVAPTGSGKTVTVCGAIAALQPQGALILTDRKNMLTQWASAVKDVTGLTAGIVGAGKWNPRRITIATVQTLHKYINHHDTQILLSRQSFMCLDEMHHVTAEMFKKVVEACPARYRIGVSATPDKTGDFEIALNTLGEIIHETTDEELQEHGLLVKPHVEVVHTEFDFSYYGDHQADKKGRCDKPGCQNRKPRHRHRNNYQETKSALVGDSRRNIQIIGNIAGNYPGHVQVVITDQIKHIDAMLDALQKAKKQWFDVDMEDVYELTGNTNKRDDIIQRIRDSSSAIVFSTIAGEGLDIKNIDRVHIVYPTRNTGKTKQGIGRGTRLLEGKDDLIVYDYADTKVPVLAKQFLQRRWKLYEPAGLEVRIPDSD